MPFIPFLGVLILFIFYQIQNKGSFSVVSLLFITYLGMFVAYFVLIFFDLGYPVFPFELSSMLFFMFTLIVMFWGVSSFKDLRFTLLKIDNIFLFKIMENFLLICGLLAIIFFSPFAYIALTGDIHLNRIAIDSVQSKLMGKWGVVNSFFSLISNFFIVNQICAFINLIPQKGKKHMIKAFFLLLSSLSYVIYILAYVGRDGFVFWIMSFVFCFLLFKNFLLKKDKKKIKRLAIGIGCVILVPFLAISISRFSESKGGWVIQLVNYYGQQVKNFNDYFLIDAPITHGRNIFPLIYDKFLNQENNIYIIEQQKRFFLQNGVEPWLFATFIGSLLTNFGKTGTILFVALISLSLRFSLKSLKKSRNLYVSNILLFTLIFQIFYWGIFYFRLYSANLYILSMIALIAVFKLLRLPSAQRTYYKNN